MGNISDAFQDALADQAKAALAEVVSKNPRTTVKELRQLVADTPALGSITLAGLLGVEAGAAKGGKGKRRKGATIKKARKGAKAAKRDVRRKEGRDQLDADVLAGLAELGGKNIAATQLRQLIGVDPTQLRTSLNRLIEQGKVTFTGKARGTRYTLV